MKFKGSTVLLAFLCGASTIAMYSFRTTSTYVSGTLAILRFLNAVRCEVLLQRIERH